MPYPHHCDRGYDAHMDVSLFDFDLPKNRIAERPARPRDSAKLLQVNGNSFKDYVFRDLPGLLCEGDVLVLNRTQVFPAHLIGSRPARSVGGGGDVRIKLDLHRRVDRRTWKAFAKPAKRLQTGDVVIFSKKLQAKILERNGSEVVSAFNLKGTDLDAEIENCGQIPLPPYILSQRSVDERDAEDYQTIFAREKGSVAAPTAGLHFTPDVFANLKNAGVDIEYLTLHVGPGTFLPVTADNTNDHKMHAEWYALDTKTVMHLNEAKRNNRRIIAVGTTVLRALESSVGENGGLEAHTRETDIFITPGYTFRVVDGLLTNFHLPKSTLFMLVSAVCGLKRMQAAYRHAIDADYRFYSYGDTSLLWKAAHG